MLQILLKTRQNNLKQLSSSTAFILWSLLLTSTIKHDSIHQMMLMTKHFHPTSYYPLAEREIDEEKWEDVLTNTAPLTTPLSSLPSYKHVHVSDIHVHACAVALTEWYIKSGVTGLFSVCLSSEMFQVSRSSFYSYSTKLWYFISFHLQLNNEERVAIARRVTEKAKGRVPVVIGATFEGGLEEQAKLMNTMGEMADSVVIITNQISTMEEVRDLGSDAEAVEVCFVSQYLA